MPDVRNGPSKPLPELTAQWDLLAEIRNQQISNGVDISFNLVVAPAALRLLAGENLALLLDIGCGTGHFSKLAAPQASRLIGIDPSSVSVEVARRVCADVPNVKFLNASIEDAADTWEGERATCAVALMVLMTAPDLSQFAEKLWGVLAPGAAFVAVIPHPCFWPTYWGYANEPWFDYMKETFVEAPFEISNAQTSICTTHIHRPLSQYLSCFSESRFSLQTMNELVPAEEVEAMYPARWAFPRFAALKWRRG